MDSLLPVDSTIEVKGLDCQTPTAENICSVATSACSAVHGTRNCATLDLTEQALRSSSPDKNAALDLVRTYFQELVRDTALQKICCKEDNQCAYRLRSTSLQIEETGNLNDWLAVTMSIRQNLRDEKTELTIIKISASRLLNGNNMETAKALLHHEFGHACEEAWKSSNTKGSRPRFSNIPIIQDGCQSDAFNEYGIEEIFGPTVTQCLRSRYRQYAQSKGWRPCIGVLLKEGFADAVFASRNDSVFHWGFDCDVRRESIHPPIQDTLSCLIEDPNQRLAVCAR